MFFQNAFGMGGSPAGLMSPGANPQSLAALMAMGQAARPPGAPTFPAIQKPQGTGMQPPQNVPGAAMAPQQNPADMMKMLEALKGNNGQGLLSQLLGGLGGNTQVGAPTSLIPQNWQQPIGPGTGGLY